MWCWYLGLKGMVMANKQKQPVLGSDMVLLDVAVEAPSALF